MAFLGPMEIGIAIVIILLLFGGKRLPLIAKGIRESIEELRKGVRDDD